MALLTAASALYAGFRDRQAQQTNAAYLGAEKNLTIDQANAQEGMVRRASREALGRQTAAFGASGAGYGGSSATALKQSAVNQELDALTTRYKGAIAGYGYGVQSGFDRQEGETAQQRGGLLAGAALLKGLSGSYGYQPETPSLA